MSDQNKEPQTLLIDPAKLAEYMKLTKQKYKFLEKIDGLEDQLTASIQQRSKDKAQHVRELEIVIAANSKSVEFAKSTYPSC